MAVTYADLGLGFLYDFMDENQIASDRLAIYIEKLNYKQTKIFIKKYFNELLENAMESKDLFRIMKKLYFTR